MVRDVRFFCKYIAARGGFDDPRRESLPRPGAISMTGVWSTLENSGQQRRYGGKGGEQREKEEEGEFEVKV